MEGNGPTAVHAALYEMHHDLELLATTLDGIRKMDMDDTERTILADVTTALDDITDRLDELVRLNTGGQDG